MFEISVRGQFFFFFFSLCFLIDEAFMRNYFHLVWNQYKSIVNGFVLGI